MSYFHPCCHFCILYLSKLMLSCIRSNQVNLESPPKKVQLAHFIFTRDFLRLQHALLTPKVHVNLTVVSPGRVWLRPTVTTLNRQCITIAAGKASLHLNHRLPVALAVHKFLICLRSLALCLTTFIFFFSLTWRPSNMSCVKHRIRLFKSSPTLHPHCLQASTAHSLKETLESTAPNHKTPTFSL